MSESLPGSIEAIATGMKKQGKLIRIYDNR